MSFDFLPLEACVFKEFNCQWLGSGCYVLTAAEVALNTQ